MQEHMTYIRRNAGNKEGKRGRLHIFPMDKLLLRILNSCYTKSCRLVSMHAKMSTFNTQWNLDLTNLYITKSSVLRMIFFSPVKITVKYIEQNLDIMNFDVTKTLP